jgi:ATP-binding cassette subfamily B multidrug efflux pump
MSENKQGGRPPVGPGRPGGMRRGPMGGHGPGGFGRPVEKPKDFKGTFKRLMKYLRPHMATLIVVFIFAIASTVFTVYAPMRSRVAMNSFQHSLVAKGVMDGITKVEADARVQAGLKMQGIPLLKDAATNEEKADAVGKLIAAMQKMTPDQMKTMMPAEGGGQTGTQFMGYDLSKLTQNDLDTFIGYIRDTGGAIQFDEIGRIVLQLLALYLLSAGFSFVMAYMMSSVSQITVRVMRSDVNDKLARLPLKFFDSRTHGEILSRMTNDMDTVGMTLQQNLTTAITSVVSIVGYVIMMLTISPIMTLIVLATLPLYIIATMFIAKKSQKYYAAQQKHLGELSGHVEEMYGGHKVVKAFGHEEKSIEMFKGINDKLYGVGWKAQFMSGIMFPLMNFISNLGYVLICVVGGTYAAKKALEVGDITTFIQYSRSFTQPIVQMSNIANVIQSTIACAERVFEVLDEAEQIPDKADSVKLESPEGAVSFNDVKFGYSEDKILMDDMDIHVKPGQTIAIVGPTGAGKTTLVNLLMRFYEVNAGSITLDGVDTRDMKRADLRRIFGMVLQDTWLFNGTIRDNIAYGRDGATEEEIVAAAKAAHADRFVRTLPEGYDTVLNEEASNISQGQKQLLTIARAILADPPIIILDEATSSVDTRTEIRIQRAMHNLMKGRTSFVIAHRLSTIRDADLILVMDHGSIVETGTHESLLADKGFYYDMYMSQFTGAYNAEEEAV